MGKTYGELLLENLEKILVKTNPETAALVRKEVNGNSALLAIGIENFILPYYKNEKMVISDEEITGKLSQMGIPIDPNEVSWENKKYINEKLCFMCKIVTIMNKKKK